MSNQKLLQVALRLALLSMFCVIIEMVRIYISLDTLYIFMPWNLLLAWVPLFFAWRAGKASSPHILFMYLLLWLLFFPNAPYVMTDLLHLKPRIDFPFWYDVMLLFSFAFTGLLTGILSALIVYKKLKALTSTFKAWLFMFIAMLLSGYGIYLGRFLRFNSWQVVTMPKEILYQSATRLLHPMAHLRTYGVTLLSAVLLLLVICIFESILAAE